MKVYRKFGSQSGDTNLYGYVANDPVNFVDPLGLFTLQLGFSFNYQIGPVGLQGGFGVALDTQGNIGGYNFGGVQGGVGGSTSGGFSVQASDAGNICDLKKGFNNGSASFGEGLAGSVDYSMVLPMLGGA